MRQLIRIGIVLLAILTVTDLSWAQRRGGGGFRGGGGGFRGGGFRGGSGAMHRSRMSARPTINHRPAARPAARPANRPSQLPARPNRDLGDRGNINRGDINVDRGDINVDRDIDVDGDWNWDGDGCCYNRYPIARAATAAAITAAAVGSVVYSLPPSCTTVVIDGVTYQDCGGTWYQPQYYGTSTGYVVVTAPR